MMFLCSGLGCVMFLSRFLFLRSLCFFGLRLRRFLGLGLWRFCDMLLALGSRSNMHNLRTYCTMELTLTHHLLTGVRWFRLLHAAAAPGGQFPAAAAAAPGGQFPAAAAAAAAAAASAAAAAVGGIVADAVVAAAAEMEEQRQPAVEDALLLPAKG